ncbi:hypothetical protein D3C71_1789730 [compost metagenome]
MGVPYRYASLAMLRACCAVTPWMPTDCDPVASSDDVKLQPARLAINKGVASRGLASNPARRRWALNAKPVLL